MQCFNATLSDFKLILNNNINNDVSINNYVGRFKVVNHNKSLVYRYIKMRSVLYGRQQIGMSLNFEGWYS